MLDVISNGSRRAQRIHCIQDKFNSIWLTFARSQLVSISRMIVERLLCVPGIRCEALKEHDEEGTMGRMLAKHGRAVRYPSSLSRWTLAWLNENKAGLCIIQARFFTTNRTVRERSVCRFCTWSTLIRSTPQLCEGRNSSSRIGRCDSDDLSMCVFVCGCYNLRLFLACCD